MFFTFEPVDDFLEALLVELIMYPILQTRFRRGQGTAI